MRLHTHTRTYIFVLVHAQSGTSVQLRILTTEALTYANQGQQAGTCLMRLASVQPVVLDMNVKQLDPLGTG